jgi:hypothetical protein
MRHRKKIVSVGKVKFVKNEKWDDNSKALGGKALEIEKGK